MSTDISELGSEEGPNPSETSFNLNAAVVDVSQVFQLDQNFEMTNQDVENMSGKEEAESKLRDLDTKVRDMCDDLPADLITELSAPLMQGELDKIAVVRDEYRRAVRAFLSEFASELVSTEKNAWEADLTSLLNTVKSHKFTVLEKVSSFTQPATPMTEFERESIELLKKKLHLKMEALEGKIEEALAAAQPLKQLVTEKCRELDEELEQITSAQILDGDDQLVIKTMQKLAGWKASMESIRITYQEFQTTTALYKLSQSDHTALDAAVKSTKDSLDSIISVAESEDDKRGLYSLDTSVRGEQVKWPVFAGDAGEDFFKFKKDFLDAAKQNRTSTRNQITKLRENLRGYAKTLVPTSISDISKGLDILEHACGDSMKVVTHRVNNLLKVGPWPQEGSKECYSRQIKWIINVQTNLQEIIELANAEEELGDIIYNREKLAQILKLFPSFIVDKVVKMPGYKEKKYKEIIAKLDEVKKVSQNRELIYGPGGGVSGSGGDSKNQGNNQVKADKLPTGHTFFPQPKKYDDCRICKVLQAQGGSSGLFLNHISDYATGCPLFASLGTEQRFVVVKEAKLCPRCMGKDVTTSRDHFTKCPVLKKKNSYSCKSEKCTFHMWLCSRHPDANKEQMQKFEEQLRTKSGIRLVFMAGKRKVRAPSVSSDNNPVPTEGTCDLPHLKPPDPSPHSPVLEPTSPDVANPPPSDTITPGSPHSYCAKSQLGIKRAVRKMNRFNKKSDPGVETVSPPEGSPLFMFQPVEGLQEPVNLFYDCGASEAIFRQGIPGKQLRGTMLAKGPFSMGGVGDIATVAEEEWLIQLNRCDNKKQLVRGVTMKQITCCFPPIDTTKAVEEVKSSDKDDQFLQSCNIPDIAGGHVDVLLGIQYLSIFPPIVRQLDCGLTIFESRLVSHNKKMNAIIGGPHTSFQFLAEKAGNTAKLLAHFTEGLMNLRKLGPPRIPVNPLSQEDEIFAKAYNMGEQQEIFDLASKEKTGDDSGFCFCLFSDDSPDKLREI